MPSKNYQGFTGRFVTFTEPSATGNRNSIGIVTCVDGETVCVQHYEQGYPVRSLVDLRVFTVNEVPLESALEHFAGIMERLDDAIRRGGARGAFKARSKDILRGAVRKLSLNQDPYDVALNPPEEPNTGMYVAMGLYEGVLESPFFQAFSLVESLSEKTAAEILFAIHPQGFEDIPDDGQIQGCHRELCGYKIHRVPQKSIEIVGKYRRLELILRVKD